MKIFVYFLLLLLNYVRSFQYDSILTDVSLNISQSTYCIASTNNWNCKTCDQNNVFETSSLINGEYIIYGYNKLYNSVFVGFRGSSNIENWISNIRFLKVYPYENKNIGIEKGFYNLFNSNKPKIYENLKKIVSKYNTNKLILTGHSSGGALATLLSFDIKNNDHPYDIKLTTFGSPRVGNKEFSNQLRDYNFYSIRITHYYDVVPHLPQNKLNFEHVLQEIWYNDDNTEYKICSSNNPEDPNCSDKCAPFECTSIDNHLNYLNVSMGKDGDC